MGTNAIVRAHVEDLFARADKHSDAAEEIRPGNGNPDYMLDGVDDIENDAIATALDERASELRHLGATLGQALGWLDTESSASRQHFIETGRYLRYDEAHCRGCGHTRQDAPSPTCQGGLGHDWTYA